MLFFLVSCLSFVLLLLKPYPTSKIGSRIWIFCEAFIILARKGKIFIRVFQLPKISIPSIKKLLRSRFVEEREEKKEEISLLDLPDLALDSILEKLSPLELCRVACVCTSLREKCTSNHLWKKHLKQKWGGIIGEAVYRQWQSHVSSKRALMFLSSMARRSQLRYFVFEFFGFNTDTKERQNALKSCSLSVMSFYLALETGKFWFPAQVFNRENGHVGFMLSCYDAKLSYDSTTDNFVARYPAQGRSIIEEGIEWGRIRASSVDTPPNVVHISDCLDELKPNDHIEIQWRRNTQFPFGWWYGVVGHLDSCTSNQFYCQCHISDTIVLEFRQYIPESPWRKTMINRKDHREVGNEGQGFYGGIRKLCNKQEIEKWKYLRTNCTLE